jgi:hypothetical protein
MYVEEKDRSWCSSNSVNDNRAITIECASDKTHPYAINDKVYKSLIELLVDICKRNGIPELKWKADKSLIGQPDKQNMTVHRWFANKSCPGDYIYNRLGQIASEVNAKLNSGSSNTNPKFLYRVQTGAFSKKENAEAMLAKVKAAGFDTYMVKDNLYKIQVGAFSKKTNADAMAAKLKAAGLILTLPRKVERPWPHLRRKVSMKSPAKSFRVYGVMVRTERTASLKLVMIIQPCRRE